MKISKMFYIFIFIMYLFINSIEAVVLYQEDFNDGVADNMVFPTGNWVVQNGKLIITSDPLDQCNLAGSVALVTTVQTIDQFSIEVDMKLTNLGDRGHIGVVFAATNESLPDFNTTYIRTHADHFTAWSRTNGQGGCDPEIHINFPCTNNVTYHFKLEINYSDRIANYYVNNNLIGSITGDNFSTVFRRTEGYIGLITWDPGEFDNLIIEGVLPATPTPTVTPTPPPIPTLNYKSILLLIIIFSILISFYFRKTI